MDFKKTLIAASLAVFSAGAAALPIQGGISFSVDGSPFPNNSYLTSVTEFDFYNLTGDVSTLGMTATGLSGDFASASLGITAATDFTLREFKFDPGLASTPTLVWDSNDLGIEFYLDSVTVTQRETINLDLFGQGYLSDGDDSIQGIWSASVQEAGSTFSFSTSTAVPEPGSIALFGLGLAGIGFASRRKAKSA